MTLELFLYQKARQYFGCLIVHKEEDVIKSKAKETMVFYFLWNTMHIDHPFIEKPLFFIWTRKFTFCKVIIHGMDMPFSFSGLLAGCGAAICCDKNCLFTFSIHAGIKKMSSGA